MKTAEAQIYLDKIRMKSNGKCSVKIKITHNRVRKYYSTGIDLSPDEFNQIMNGKRRTPDQKEIYLILSKYLNKANEILLSLKVFTFASFEESFLETRNTNDSVSFAFDKYVKQLRDEGRVGTAASYETAKKSILSFKPRLTFAEINPTLLKGYENWMTKQGSSLTTVGIYLRSLRTIYNQQDINPVLYPFGSGKGKYSIPTGRNIKKALTVDEVSKIYNYEAPFGSSKDMAKDYWVFLYLSNGMNVKDFCLLKWSDIDGDLIRFKRAKTIRSKKDSKSIIVALKDETKEIIKKHGRPSIVKDAYIFPHLNKDMTPEQERATIKQLTKTVNKYIKQIATEVGISKTVTTYFARHSFATVLKRSGASIGMISELLGHGSVSVTESYLDSFESDQIQKQTEVLTAGFRKAK